MFTLFSKSKAPKIYFPQDASDVLRLAVADLQKDIESVSERELKVELSQSKSDADIVIEIDESSYFHPEEFKVEISDRIYIGAHDEMGAMWGIYTFSSDILGVHPLFAINKIAPEKHPSMIIDREKLCDFPRDRKIRAISLEKADLLKDNPEIFNRIADCALRLKLNAVILPDFLSAAYAEKRGLSVNIDASRADVIETGSHFAQCASPSVIKNILSRKTSDVCVFSVHNAREYACSIAAYSQASWDVESFDADEFLESYCAETFGCEDVGKILNEYFGAFASDGQRTVSDMYIKENVLNSENILKYTEDGLKKFGAIFNKFAEISEKIATFGEEQFMFECILQARYMYDICGWAHFTEKDGKKGAKASVSFINDAVEARKIGSLGEFASYYKNDCIINPDELISIANSAK